MAEPTTTKKTVYTRKKSTTAIQRKGPTSKNEASNSTETETDVDSSPTKIPHPGKDLSLRPVSPHPKPHYNRHHHTSNSSSLRKHVLVRRSPSPSATMSPGYEQYQMALLEVPLPRDYGDASSDDLSSEWDSDAPDSRSNSFLCNGAFKVNKIATLGNGWRKLTFWDLGFCLWVFNQITMILWRIGFYIVSRVLKINSPLTSGSAWDESTLLGDLCPKSTTDLVRDNYGSLDLNSQCVWQSTKDSYWEILYALFFSPKDS